MTGSNVISHAYEYEKEIYGKRHGKDELCSDNTQNHRRSISTVLVLGPVLSQTDQSVAGSGCDLRRNWAHNGGQDHDVGLANVVQEQSG